MLTDIGSHFDEWQVPAPLSYDPPRWMTEAYPGMETDIAEDIFRAIYWRKLAEETKTCVDAGLPVPNPEDIAIKARSIADALTASTAQADQMQDASRRAFMALLYKVNSTGAFRMLPEEYDSLEEWIADRMPAFAENGGEMADARFLVEQIFPMLAKYDGVSPEQLLSIRDNWSRFRASVPYLRAHLREFHTIARTLEQNIEKKKDLIERLQKLQEGRSEDHPKYKETEQKILTVTAEIEDINSNKDKKLEDQAKQFASQFQSTLEVIADPTVKAWGRPDERTIANVLKHGDIPELKIYDGFRGTMDGRTIFVIVVPNQLERAVESGLSTTVQFRMTDPKILGSIVEGWYKKDPFAEQDEAEQYR